MKRLIVIIVAFVAIITCCCIQHNVICKLRAERDRYKGNTETLLTDVEVYKTRDSLNAAKVGSLELTIKEFERFRAADAKLIKTLQTRNRDLQAVTTTQAQTIVEMSAVPRDTIIIRDSVAVPAIAVHTGDCWFDFDGLLTENEFAGTLAVRDSLLIAETVQYKRFCGFLWKTKKIKNREIDVVSKCPYTTITGMEHIIMEK